MRPFALVSVVTALGCEGPFVPPTPYPPPPAAPASVAVTPDSATVITDDTLRLAAQVKDTAGNVLPGAVLSWVSSDTTIVTIVNALGTVRGLRPGSATVRVYAGAVAGAVTVFVTPVVYNGLATGANHVCAVANNRHAYCWGKNDDAQIGTGSSSFIEPVPRRVGIANALTAVAAGSAHSCAIDQTGAVWCWGRETNGRLGRGGSPSNPAIPLPIASSAHFAQVVAGGAHTCGLDPSGLAICWGAGGSGQLGDGVGMDRSIPAQVGSLETRFLVISTGAVHTCAVATDQNAWCWGGNSSGQVGDRTTGDELLPTQIGAGQTFTTISAGGSHSCAVSTAGAASCWGANSRGQTGTGLPDSLVLAPTSVAGGLLFGSISAGGQHSCGITTDSLAYCWGANTSGQLGDSSQIDRAAPVLVHGGLRFTEVHAGAAFTCGLTDGLVLYCWGDGTQGQLGRSFLASSNVPVKVAGQ
ncbi:MAG TPA: Ig-like domain-containing protein [Gemmatimonadales bacterium]|nr:Ig-like domain-containing protein [Gemmatimonadales bacterium]